MFVLLHHLFETARSLEIPTAQPRKELATMSLDSCSEFGSTGHSVNRLGVGQVDGGLTREGAGITAVILQPWKALGGARGESHLGFRV